MGALFQDRLTVGRNITLTLSLVLLRYVCQTQAENRINDVICAVRAEEL
jgi:hypothetical protein